MHVFSKQMSEHLWSDWDCGEQQEGRCQ